MKVITLNREFGAGGHSIGTEVAKRLGIEFYDRDIISGAAKANGIDIEAVESEEEEISRADTFFRTISPIAYDSKDVIFEAEKKVILDVAAKGPCVILGRCADWVLEQAGIETFDVYIYADEESRYNRVAELIGSEDSAEIKRAIKRHDHNRYAFYHYYTDRDLYDFRNYDLMLDSGALGYEACIETIVNLAKNI